MLIGLFLILAADIEVTREPLGDIFWETLGTVYASDDKLFVNGFKGMAGTVMEVDLHAETSTSWNVTKYKMFLPRLLPHQEGYLLLGRLSKTYVVFDQSKNMITRGHLREIASFPIDGLIQGIYPVTDATVLVNMVSMDRLKSSVFKVNFTTMRAEKVSVVNLEPKQERVMTPFSDGYLELIPFTGAIHRVSSKGKRIGTYFPGTEPLLRDPVKFKRLSKRRPYWGLISQIFQRDELVIFFWLETRESFLKSGSDRRIATAVLRDNKLTFDAGNVIGCVGELCLNYDFEDLNFWVEKAPAWYSER